MEFKLLINFNYGIPTENEINSHCLTFLIGLASMGSKNGIFKNLTYRALNTAKDIPLVQFL